MLKTAVTVYIMIAIPAFIANASIGPVMPGLALVRGLLWPLWLAGMIPGHPIWSD